VYRFSETVGDASNSRHQDTDIQQVHHENPQILKLLSPRQLDAWDLCMPELVVHLNKSNVSVNTWYTVIIFYCTTVSSGPQLPHYLGFMITLKHTTLTTTLMDECSVQHRDLYLTTHNIHNRQAPMPPSGIQTRKPSKRAAVDPHFRPCSHWDWSTSIICSSNMADGQTWPKIHWILPQ
jgi:hypothetical protein